jgi:uncharacterized protein YceH (UPF0502 family)
MPVQLSPLEARVIASLIEKEIATPEHYPLSLNALTNACNQKSNRDPVLDLDEATVQQTVDVLERRYLVSSQTGYGSRVSKYQHRFCNTNFGELRFTPQELAIICELLLRGPQTPGELRTRASRLCAFGDVSEVETTLRALSVREDGPFVVRLAREPGRRESRYVHCFAEVMEAVDDLPIGPHAPGADQMSAMVSMAPTAPSQDRINHLEQRVAALEDELASIKQLLEDLTSA